MTIVQKMKEIQEQADALQKTIDTPVPNVFELAMSQFPASSTNNARKIVLEKIKSFEESPSDRKAKELEELGFSVDHSDYFDKIDDIERNNDR